MLRRRCPFIGLCNDPETVVGFASLRNCCNRVENPQPVQLNYQHSHCFNFDHRYCPVLKADKMATLPPEIAARGIRKTALWVTGGLVSVLVVLLLAMVFFGGWRPAGAVDRSPTASPSSTILLDTVTAQPEVVPSATLAAGSPFPSETLVPAVTNTAAPSPMVRPSSTLTPASTECSAPSGWGIYIVQAGDTLFNIANLQGVTVAELQAANCLTTTVLYVGQQLYVPHPDLMLPSPTFTGTPTLHPSESAMPTATETPAPPTDTPLPSDTPTDTPVPPTPSDTPTDTPVPPTPSNTPVFPTPTADGT